MLRRQEAKEITWRFETKWQKQNKHTDNLQFDSKQTSQSLKACHGSPCFSARTESWQFTLTFPPFSTEQNPKDVALAPLFTILSKLLNILLPVLFL